MQESEEEEETSPENDGPSAVVSDIQTEVRQIRRLLLLICARLPIPPAEINAALQEENTEGNTDTTPVIN